MAAWHIPRSDANNRQYPVPLPPEQTSDHSNDFLGYIARHHETPIEHHYYSSAQSHTTPAPRMLRADGAAGDCRPVGLEDSVGYPVVVVEVAVGKEDAGAGRAAHAHDAFRQADGTDDLVRYDDGMGAPAVSRGRARRKSGPRLKAAEDGLMGGPSRRHRAAGCNWRASPFWRPRPPLSALRFRAFSGLPDGTPVWRAAQVRSGPDPMRPHGFLPDTPIIPHPDPGCGRKRPLRL